MAKFFVPTTGVADWRALRAALVEPALVAAGIFALLVASFSSPGGTIGNLPLSSLRFVLAVSG